MNANSVTVTLTLKTPFFAHDTQSGMTHDVSPYWLGYKWDGSVMHKISSKLTLTETFNLSCDIDLEHSNPIFSLDTSLLMMIDHQIEFGCKRLTGIKVSWCFTPSQPV